MHLLEVFKESVILLKKEPKVFVPRILMTCLYTFFVLYSLRLGLKISSGINQEMEIAGSAGMAPNIGLVLSRFYGELAFFAIFFLLTFATDILTYGMYVRIARDFHMKRPISLIGALGDAVCRARVLFIVGALATVFVGSFIGIYLLFGRLYILTQSPLFLVASLSVILLAVIIFTVVFFFAVPVAMVENCSVKNTVIKSANLGMRHKWPVLRTNFLFFGMVLAAMVVVMITELHGALALGAILVFVFGRLLQALIYTYISIVNPTLYLSIKTVDQ